MRDGKQGRREMGDKEKPCYNSQVVNGKYLFSLPNFGFYIET